MAKADPVPLIRARALELGFDAVGFAEATLAPEAGRRLREFVAAGMHGDMGWMADTLERRADPKALWPAARTAIVVAGNYGPAEDPRPALARRARGVISAYARNRDYHRLLKGRTKQLAGFVAARTGGAVKAFVDTAPLMEKPLAEAAGLGWQGKHTNLVSRDFGSWLFLGAVLAERRLEPDPPGRDLCGACSACLDVCPTRAFPAPYRLDARRCISYLTIEHQGPIDRELRPLMGNRIFGCDDCLAVCPWNRFARPTAEPGFRARGDLAAPRLAELAALDEGGFRRRFAGTAVRRTGRARFVRNVLVALGNAGQRELAPAARARLDDADPLVRGTAAWALARLDPEAFRSERAARLPVEEDAGVREEWRAA